MKKADVAALVAVARKVLDHDFGCGCCSWNEDSDFQPKAALREALKPFTTEGSGGSMKAGQGSGSGGSPLGGA